MFLRGTSRMAPLAAVCLLAASGARAAQAHSIGVGPEAGKLRLAVMDFSGSALRMQAAQTPLPQGGTQATQTTALPPPPESCPRAHRDPTTTLVNTGRFVVLERQQTQALIAEQDLNAAGRVNKETGAAQGRIIRGRG